MDSINQKLKKNERIYGCKTAQKKASILKEEFKSKFINKWKENKANIESLHNNIDKITRHLESVNRDKDKYIDELMSIQTQSNNVRKQIEEVNDKISEMNKFLRKTKLMASQMDKEKYEVLKDSINELLNKKN